MYQTSYVHDCISNLIFLNEYVWAYGKPVKLSTEQCLQSAKTIAASDIIIEVHKSLKKYYYCSFGLHDTLLTGVNFNNGIWKVNSHYENPSATFLLTLFKKELLGSSITMYHQREITDDFLGSKMLKSFAEVL